MGVGREEGCVYVCILGATGMSKDPTSPLQTLLVFKNTSDCCFGTMDLQEDLS